MRTDEFEKVDFSQPQIIRSLARAYAVLLNLSDGKPALPEKLEQQIAEQKTEQDKGAQPTKQPQQKQAALPIGALVQRFRRLFLAGVPETHSKMQRPGAAAKYFKRFHSLTDVEIASHLEGRATFAAPLIGRDGFTREAALDIDQGGEEAIIVGLQVVAELGYSAYGLVSQAVEGGHNGGHIHIPLADVAAPERARLLAEQIKQAVLERCGLPENVIEVYPTRKGLRLPFGIHTYTDKRGKLLLPDGTHLDLDCGEALTTIARALTLLEALPPNNPDTLLMLPVKPVLQGPLSPPNALQRPRGGSPIQDYLQTTNLLDWLITVGARMAYQTSTGSYVLHCPCPHHAHGDARPSLELQPAKNPRHGSYVLIGYAAGCVLATEPGRIINAFDAYCRWYGLSTREALDRLYPRYNR